jgi:hypothetical protein
VGRAARARRRCGCAHRAAPADLAWVQLPFAGIETFVDLVDDDRVWTCGKGVYAQPVAEMALRSRWPACATSARTRGPSWSAHTAATCSAPTSPSSAAVASPRRCCRLLAPFDCHVTVVRNRVHGDGGRRRGARARPLRRRARRRRCRDRRAGAHPGDRGHDLALRVRADVPHAWLVNVARGRHIVTDDLVWALQHGVIGGAALDVTDPEPLPPGHPLWSLPNCIITPHVGNTPEMAVPLLAERITTNVRRFANGEPLVGPDPHRPRVLSVAGRAEPSRVRSSVLSPTTHRRRLRRGPARRRHVDAVIAATGGSPLRRSARRWASWSRSVIVDRQAGVLHVLGAAFQQRGASSAGAPADPTSTTSCRRARRKVMRRLRRRRSAAPRFPRRSTSAWWCSTGWRRTFEPGRRYSEAMVNLMLGKRHADTAALASIHGRRRPARP